VVFPADSQHTSVTCHLEGFQIVNVACFERPLFQLSYFVSSCFFRRVAFMLVLCIFVVCCATCQLLFFV